MPGKKSLSIALDQPNPTFGQQVTFTVTQSNYKNPYVLWVACKASIDGELVMARYQPVRWPAGPYAPGTTDPFLLDNGWIGEGDPWTGQPAEGLAYVWEFPASETPERDGELAFAIAGA